MTRKAKPSKGKRATTGTSSAVAKPGRRGKPENLKPWKKGQSGNPAGLSKARRRLTQALALACQGEMPTEQAAKEMLAIFRNAEGDVPWPVRWSAFMELLNRGHGKAPDVIEGKLGVTGELSDEARELLEAVREAKRERELAIIDAE